MKSLVLEIHRRSLWQVLGIYLAGSWISLQVVETLADSVGLPAWVQPFAVVLLVIGFPIVMATAFVQEGVKGGGAAVRATEGSEGHPAPEEREISDVDSAPTGTPVAAAAAPVAAATPGSPRGLFTWRNALLGGAAAFALLGILTAGYMAARTLGIGPAATLVAAGVLDERERVVLADFGSGDSDANLSTAATEAFRVDLAESPMLSLVDPAHVAETLELMERAGAEKLDEDLAREVAVRRGLKAVIAGDITPAGRGYVLTARLVSASDGTVLSAHRATARDTAAVLESIDELSRKLREKVGESLKSTRASQPLQHVTTGSLEALRKYSQAVMAIDHEGDGAKGIALLEEVLAADSTFAMAWRKIGAEKRNRRYPRSEWVDALFRAYELSDRLTDRERYLATASYHAWVTNDDDRVIQAYEAMLDLDPDDFYALHNLNLLYRGMGEYERAEPLAVREIQIDSSTFSFAGLMIVQTALGKFDEAASVLEGYETRYPDNPDPVHRRAQLAAVRGDFETSVAIYQERGERFRNWPGVQGHTSIVLSNLAALQGRLEESEAHARDFARTLEEEDRTDVLIFAEAGLPGGRDTWIRDDPQAAMRRMEAVLEKYPIDQFAPEDRPYFSMARTYARAGHTDRAREILQTFMEETPPELQEGADNAVRSTMGDIAMAEGRYADAVDEYLRAEDGRCTGRCGSLAEAYEKAGQQDSALALYERYVNVSRLGVPPANRYGPILERLGQLYDERGDLEKAAEYYARFVGLWAGADEELQPRVRAAQARLEEIVRERG